MSQQGRPPGGGILSRGFPALVGGEWGVRSQHRLDVGRGLGAPARADHGYDRGGRVRRGRIFQPYVSHPVGGHGRGLSTARRIIEEHGGRITVHSDIGRGSDFVIHLPRKGRK